MLVPVGTAPTRQHMVAVPVVRAPVVAKIVHHYLGTMDRPHLPMDLVAGQHIDDVLVEAVVVVTKVVVQYVVVLGRRT